MKKVYINVLINGQEDENGRTVATIANIEDVMIALAHELESKPLSQVKDALIECLFMNESGEQTNRCLFKALDFCLSDDFFTEKCLEAYDFLSD